MQNDVRLCRLNGASQIAVRPHIRNGAVHRFVRPMRSWNDGSVGGGSEIPETSLPSAQSHADAQPPMKPDARDQNTAFSPEVAVDDAGAKRTPWSRCFPGRGSVRPHVIENLHLTIGVHALPKADMLEDGRSAFGRQFFQNVALQRKVFVSRKGHAPRQCRKRRSRH